MLLLFLFNDREIHIVVFRFSTDTKTSSLHVGENNAYKLSKRGGIQYRDAFTSTLLSIAAVYTIASHRTTALPAILLQPREM